MRKPAGAFADIFLIFLIMAITGITRWIYAEADFGGLSYDPANYRLAALDYNLGESRPHLPGYYLHVQSIRLLAVLFSNIHTAQLSLSILYSMLAMGGAYVLLRRWFPRQFALLLTGVMLTFPMNWFYGSATEIYAFDLFFGTFLVLLGSHRRGIYLTPLFAGILGGVRPSSPVLLLGLYAYLWYRHLRTAKVSLASVLLAHLAGLAGLLAWLAPMVATAGGIGAYMALYETHYPVENISPLQNIFRLSSFAVQLLLPWGMALLAVAGVTFFSHGKGKHSMAGRLPYDRGYVLLMAWWCVPPLLFFLLMHYSKGYFLLCSVAFLGLLVPVLARIPWRAALLSGIIIVQTLLFVLMPYHPPAIDTLLSRSQRQMGLPAVWMNRTTSVYLLAQSHIAALGSSYDHLQTALHLSRLPTDATARRALFVDPTFPINVRSLQVKMPDRLLARMALHQPGHYWLHAGLATRDDQDIGDFLAGAVVVSRKAFVDRFLQGRVRVLAAAGDIVLFTIAPEDARWLQETYERLFVRSSVAGS